MSRIEAEQVRKIAELSRLELSDAEVDLFSTQLADILGYIESLSEVDVDGVEPFLNAAVEGNVLREDKDRESLPTDDALANAPHRSGDFFSVPRVT